MCSYSNNGIIFFTKCVQCAHLFSRYIIIIIIFLLMAYPLYPILVFFFSRTCFVCVRFQIQFIQGKHHVCNGKAGKSLHEIIESARKYISVIFMFYFFPSYLPIFHRSCSQGWNFLRARSCSKLSQLDCAIIFFFSASLKVVIFVCIFY